MSYKHQIHQEREAKLQVFYYIWHSQMKSVHAYAKLCIQINEQKKAII